RFEGVREEAATRSPRGCQACWIADNFQSPGAPPNARLYVHTSVTCCGVEGSGETMLPVIRSTIESIKENRIATVAYSAFCSRHASARSPCKSFTVEILLTMPLRLLEASSSAK